MLGNTASNILSMLKGEIGNDMDTSVSPGGDAVLYQQIYNQQNWLLSEYDWPFLRIYSDISLAQGQRYYPMPSDPNSNPMFNLDRPIKGQCYWSNLWNDTDIGITIYDYNVVNPDIGMTLVPVKKWQLYINPSNPSAPLQFEVWPVPSDGTMKFRMTGQQFPASFANPTDKATLDDMLIMLFCAAQFFSMANPNRAQAAVAKAKARLDRLIGGYNTANDIFVLDSENTSGRFQRRDWSMQPTVATMIGGTNAGK